LWDSEVAGYAPLVASLTWSTDLARNYNNSEREKDAYHRAKLKQHLAMIASMERQEALEEELARKAHKLGITVDDMGVRGGNIDRKVLRRGRASKLRPRNCICPQCERYFPDLKDWTKDGKCMACAKSGQPAPIAPLVKNPPACKVCHAPKPNPRTLANGVCYVCIAKGRS